MWTRLLSKAGFPLRFLLLPEKSVIFLPQEAQVLTPLDQLLPECAHLFNVLLDVQLESDQVVEVALPRSA